VSAGAGGWRVAARLARREVRRRPGRTALVAALVALPVAGMLVAVVFMRTDAVSLADRWRFENGRADAVLFHDTEVTPGPLPDGSHAVDHTSTWRVVGAASGRLCSCGLIELPFEPLTDGIVTVSAGRHPERPDEVLLSEPAADALGARLGERIELVRPFELDATVVGIGYESQWRDSPVMVLDPGAHLLDVDSMDVSLQRLVDLPDDLTRAEVGAWEATAGPHTMSAAYPVVDVDGEDDSPNAAVLWTWAAGAAGLTVLGIVIAAAFAASARRQLVTLGQLAANGATPALLRRVLFLQGTATGVVGTAAGLILGALVLVAARPWADRLLGHAYLGMDIRLLDILPIVVIALVAATVAALIPALGASRVSVLAALAGRRPLGRVSRRRTALGLASIAAGTGLLAFAAYLDRDRTGGGIGPFATACAVVGPVLLLLGVCTATPAYVTVLHPVARVLRGHWRLAARSLFRHRTRTGALVSAICAISAVAVAAAAVGLARERDDRRVQAVSGVPGDEVRIDAEITDPDGFALLPPPEVLTSAARKARAALPDAERYDLAHAVDPVRRAVPMLEAGELVPTDPSDPDAPDGGFLGPPASAIIADDELRDYGIDAATLRRLDEIGAVWSGPTAGRVTIEATLPPGTLPPFSFTAAVVGPGHTRGFGASGGLLLTPERAAELGLVAAPAEVVLRAPQPLSAIQIDDLGQLSLQFQAEAEDAAVAADDPLAVSPRVWVAFEPARRSTTPGLIETVPAAIALLFALLVVAVGLALAAAETRDERDVLAVLGAAPRTLRRASGGKAFLLTLLGGAAAVPVGLLPVAVVTRLLADDFPLVVPWRTIALIVVVVPVLAAVVTSAAARVASRDRPVQISTASFD
jgi:putative ABC transport system permease protein